MRCSPVHGHDDRGGAILEGAVLCNAVEVGANGQIAKDKERILKAGGGKGLSCKDKQRRLQEHQSLIAHEYHNLATRARTGTRPPRGGVLTGRHAEKV